MNDNNQMQPEFATEQCALFMTPFMTSTMNVDEENPGVHSNVNMADDQLANFMSRAMTLEQAAAPKIGSFIGCAARLNGTTGNQELQTFILNITLYKDSEGISDEQALQELHLLLEGKAAAWWNGVRGNIFSWSAALLLIQKTFSQKKPAYKIYEELFATKQDAYIPTEMFIRQKQSLLTDLPYTHSENVQIDMIYSLLKQKIRDKVPRNSVASLEQLIDASNRVERKKDRKRTRKFLDFKFETRKFTLKSKRKCLRCGRSRRDRRIGDREIDCYLCKMHYLIPSNDRKPETINLVYAPLEGFNPNINPFRK